MIPFIHATVGLLQVMESYTIGRECFGMEKEFIIEVVQNCPNPACRYYKNQLELSQKSLHLSAPTYISESGGDDEHTRHFTMLL
jgi:hypothetical protein